MAFFQGCLQKSSLLHHFFYVPDRYQHRPGSFWVACALLQRHNIAGQTEGAMIMASEEAKQKKLVAAILAILLGWLGLHKFYLGYVIAGIIQLVLTFLLGIGGIIGLIEGIIYLVKSDDEFESVYINGDKNQIKFF